MSKLTINELISKREACIERLKTKTCLIHSEFLGGDIEFHSLSKGEMSDVREQLKTDTIKGLLYFIYLSADDLREKELLKSYNCDKKDNHMIIERLFTDAERSKIIDILEELNGLNNLNPDEIYKVQIDELKN